MSPGPGSASEQLRVQLERLRAEGVWAIRRPETAAAAEVAEWPETVATAELTEQAESEGGAGREQLAVIESEALECRACRLCETRTKVVFGVGSATARLMFIGEGPGRDEDLRGEPFVGKAGQLLDRIIVAMGLKREQVYIANGVKCRPPGNRNPTSGELSSCRHFLMRQVAAVAPDVIVLLGRVATQTVLETDAPLGRMRGRFHHWSGIPTLCTYHPAYLLRNPHDKRKTWEDVQLVMRLLAGETP